MDSISSYVQKPTTESQPTVPGELVHCAALSWPLPRLAQLRSGRDWEGDPQTVDHIAPGQTDCLRPNVAHQESTAG